MTCATSWLVGCCLGCIAAVAAVPASGDTIYRYRLPDGRVIYVDAPLLQGELQRVLRTERRTPGELWARWARAENQAAQARLLAEPYARERASAYMEVRRVQAEGAVDRAQRHREAGAEPLPGERVGNFGGGSRLRPEYFVRQDALDRAVMNAQSRLDRARANEAGLR